MKKLVLMAALLVLSTAATALAEIKVTGDAYVGVFNKYLWRGFDLSGDQPVAQGGMDLSFNGVTLSYWTNVQLASDSASGLASGEGNETDLTVNYTLPLGSEAVAVNIGNIFYTMDGLDDTSELYVGATLNTLLAPTLKVYYDYDEFDGDLLYALSVGHTFEIDKAKLSLGGLASFIDSSAASNELWNAELSAALDVPLSGQVSLKPSVIYSVPLGDVAENTLDNELSAGVNVIMTF